MKRQERRAIFTRKRLAAAVATRYAMTRSMRETPQPQLVRDVGGLGTPRRNRSGPRNHQQHLTRVGVLAGVRPVRQDSLECRVLGRGQLPLGIDEMPEIGNDAGERVPARFDSILAMRNGDRALRPRSERSSASDATVEVKDKYMPQGRGGHQRQSAVIGGASLENDNEVGIAPERGVDGQ